ncbi:hypothetical protein [Cryobacterium sp. PH31-L1]|uniref:hypothetical protein n=1 Tax=Cryobacterium sp. PH31-L1 TaxID=3046199 RepID=UPI0024BB1FE3|nr:hypothetical protein [Cryobacterium sp. PH31-L1]MDJ0376400.1 hypothetical protein [Cryobacterium sp. PH31-L1]
MIDNDLSRAVTNTQSAATAAVAAFNASTSPEQPEGLQTSFTTTARATAAASATSYATWQGVSEQRHINYRLWVQSPDGQRYCDWAPRASLLSQAIAARHEAILAAWRFDASQVISPAEQEAFAASQAGTTTLRSKRSRSIRRGGIALMLLSPVVWVFAYFFVLLTGGEISMQAILPVAWLLLGAGVVFAGARMARPLPTDDSDLAAGSANRVALLGFDPLTEPARLPRLWTEDPKVGERLDQFMRDAYTNFPTPSELPALRIPDVRSGRTEASIQVRAVLEQFAATDALNHL